MLVETGTLTNYYFGDNNHEFAWFRGNSLKRPHPLEKTVKIHGVYLICMEMLGSG